MTGAQLIWRRSEKRKMCFWCDLRKDNDSSLPLLIVNIALEVPARAMRQEKEN